MSRPRLFRLLRFRDISGVSGVGVIADGVEWPDKTVTVRWRGRYSSTANWRNITHVERVHGHGGSTEVVWEGDPRYGSD